MFHNSSADEIFRVENSSSAGSTYAKVGLPGTAASPQPPLPGSNPGSAGAWQQFQDDISGKPYWHNVESGQTTWDDPHGGKGNSRGEGYIDVKGVYAPVSPPNAPVVITWSGVSVLTIPRLHIGQGFKWSAEKPLLNNISGAITGGLWGIMGPSGGGKTTLLSVLSLRLDTRRMRVVGDVCINGKKFNRTTLKNMSGYVMQVPSCAYICAPVALHC